MYIKLEKKFYISVDRFKLCEKIVLKIQNAELNLLLYKIRLSFYLFDIFYGIFFCKEISLDFPLYELGNSGYKSRKRDKYFSLKNDCCISESHLTIY